jgi:hypothetical protein
MAGAAAKAGADVSAGAVAEAMALLSAPASAKAKAAARTVVAGTDVAAVTAVDESDFKVAQDKKVINNYINSQDNNSINHNDNCNKNSFHPSLASSRGVHLISLRHFGNQSRHIGFGAFFLCPIVVHVHRLL